MIWSSWGIAVKYLGVNEYFVIFYTTAFTLPPLLFGKIFISGFSLSFNGLRREFLGLALLALCLLLNNYFYFAAFNRTTIAVSVFTHYTAPLFVALLAPVILAERFDRKIFFPLVVSIAGLAAILFPGLQFGVHSFSTGALYGLASGLAYALTLICAKRLTTRLAIADLILWQNFFIVVFLLPFYLLLPDGLSAPSHYNAWISLFFLGISHCLLAPFLYLRGLQHIKALHTAIIGYLEPLAAIVLGLLINHEHPGVAIWFGGAAILLSGALTVSARNS